MSASIRSIATMLILAQLVMFVSANSRDEILRGQSQRLDKSIAILKKGYDDIFERFFWNQRLLINELEANGAKQISLSVMKLINLFALIKSNEFAIRRKTLDATKQILAQQFEAKTGKGEKQENVGLEELRLDKGLTELLVRRATLRGLVDAFNYNSQYWELLHALFGQPQPVEQSAKHTKIRVLVGQMELEYQSLVVLASRTYKSQNKLVAKYEKRIDKNVMLARLDKIIDAAMGCPNCSELSQPDEENYNVYSMFAQYDLDIRPLIRQYVDKHLLSAIEASDRVVQGGLF